MHQRHTAIFISRRNFDQVHSQNTPFVDQTKNEFVYLDSGQPAGGWYVDRWHDRWIEVIGIKGQIIWPAVGNLIKHGINTASGVSPDRLTRQPFHTHRRFCLWVF